LERHRAVALDVGAARRGGCRAKGGVSGAESKWEHGVMPEHRPPTRDVAFSGDRFFLSNFYPHPFLFNGATYATAEHAFQAAKCVDVGEACACGRRLRPHQPSRLGVEFSCERTGTRCALT